MKKFIYICACAILTGLGVFVASCTKDPYVESTTSQPQDAFLSVEEAQAFFEDSFSNNLTRSKDKSKRRFLDPGEYTPQWDNALKGQKNGTSIVEVPILSQYNYRTIHSEFTNGKAVVSECDIVQTLIIEKNLSSGNKRSYILTLIPDRNYSSKREILIAFNEKRIFSGVVLVMDGVFPTEMTKYTNGTAIEQYSLNNASREINKMHFKAIITELKNIPILYCNIKTRFFGEDMYETYNDLNEQEQDFIFEHPFAAFDFHENSKIANQATSEQFGNNGHNDSSDAYRHAYWSALNAQDQGYELASEFGIMHEYGTAIEEQNMDLYNNNVGYEIGVNNPYASEEEIGNMIMDALSNGELIITP